MFRRAIPLTIITLCAAWAALCAQPVLAQQPPQTQPKTKQPQVRPAAAEPLVEATKQETWTLGDQEWDFKDVATTYLPVKGALNPKTGAAEWTLQIAKELSAGEIAIHQETEGSPFKTILFDADKIALADEPEVQFASKLTGKPGDKVKIVVKLPPADVLGQAKFIRIERRTKVGF